MAGDTGSELEYLRDFDPRSIHEVPEGTRWCIYVTGTEIGPAGGHVPSIVYENISGHWPLSGQDGSQPWEWGTYEEAKDIARDANWEMLKLNGAAALEIVLSSFAMASRQGKL